MAFGFGSVLKRDGASRRVACVCDIEAMLGIPDANFGGDIAVALGASPIHSREDRPIHIYLELRVHAALGIFATD